MFSASNRTLTKYIDMTIHHLTTVGNQPIYNSMQIDALIEYKLEPLLAKHVSLCLAFLPIIYALLFSFS